MSKRIIRCQVYEWYGSEDFTEGRYKPKGGQEFVYEVTPEAEAIDEDELIAKWNATDITREQTERLEQLDAVASLEHRTSIPESARNDREEIVHAAREELRIKYDHGQHEHRTDLPSVLNYLASLIF